MKHFSWAGSDLSGLPIISWSFSCVEALPGGTSSHSNPLGPMGSGPWGVNVEVWGVLKWCHIEVLMEVFVIWFECF